MIKSNRIDKLDTMYPSIAVSVDNTEPTLFGGTGADTGFLFTEKLSTCYGIVLEGTAKLPNGKVVGSSEYFSFWSKNSSEIKYDGKLVVFMRIGFKGANVVGGPIEEQGRLTYIDGCSDSILIYPPRLGDPSLNHLHFPHNISQSFHTHPSIRLGVVVRGQGYACVDGEERIELMAGDMFCLDENELHRFMTTDSSMDIVVYHPDGDWGPTDHNHIMRNRTYLTK